MKGNCVRGNDGLFPFQGKPPYFYKWLRDERGNVKAWTGMHGGDKKRALRDEVKKYHEFQEDEQ